MDIRNNTFSPHIHWTGSTLILLDQSRLPGEITYINCCESGQVVEAIKRMQVRGAPALGAVAAFAILLAARTAIDRTPQIEIQELCHLLRDTAHQLKTSRPTAVNLFWAVDRMLRLVDQADLFQTANVLFENLHDETWDIYQEDLAMNKRLSDFGQQLILPNSRILTHCNAGALATTGWGTALGVVKAAHQASKNISVWATETRPLLQGARLTVWELLKHNIPTTLITDNMAGFLMKLGKIDLVLVGADRIARNGDVANKIGTYTLAVLAKAHQIPFYVAAPESTIDFSIADGSFIPIEERNPDEVRTCMGTLVTCPDVDAYNPAFDITPAELITALITDRGIVSPPLAESLRQTFGT